MSINNKERRNKKDIILKIRGLTIEFRVTRGILRAVDNVDLDVYKGEILGLAGESGCGKSVLAHAILNLVDPNGYIKSGQILLKQNDEYIDILSLSKEELRKFRWDKISIVFQGAMSSFNPVIKIKDHFIDTVKDHKSNKNEEEIVKIATKLIKDFRLDEQVINLYPHEMSGGMRQRALASLSFILNPEFIILDEPTTALDVLTQKFIIKLLREIHEKTGLTMLFITHDLATLAEITDRIAIMYLGNIVEIGTTRQIFYDPKHPYTKALLQAIPSITKPLEDLKPLPGPVPDPLNPPSGCKFHPRCPLRFKACSESRPKLIDLGDGHLVACHLYKRN